MPREIQAHRKEKGESEACSRKENQQTKELMPENK